MTITLNRIIETRDGTFGQLVTDENIFYTVERNKDGEHPRIPAGTYNIHLDVYHKGNYPAYEIEVPDRDRILIHAANLASELLGCVAPGLSMGFLDNKLAVLDSRKALGRFMTSLNDAQTETIVVNDPTS